ncbi:Por secretion system C-terminal sorting domain-containing protein [Lishizhenia tianjinensis]|uniref:Por secretion system C-terminal sorting domain-containing protein n=1 Tax=Lishizhenia tianjinensis TaxID=477690 RepID=A0A1I7A069_9FLAO|nr:T9SS type A sorting domain-containing protein [Lishizhenia tianjinensis]SFT68291.1 Por secretion system C-terminal sorting domain-containing protein [Lishizhenia tianjinensis]
MIKNLLLFGAVSFSLTATAQDYNLSVSSQNYTDLTGEISLTHGQVWDDPFDTIPIGFDFDFFSRTLDTLYLSDFGLGGMLLDKADDGVNPMGDVAVFLPYGTDIIDRGDFTGSSESEISYKVEGAVGNRITKIQWKNVGFYSGPYADYTNFQLWLHEADGTFAIHFGPTSVSQPMNSYEGETGTAIAFVPLMEFDSEVISEDGFYLSGDPASPTMEVMSTGDVIEYLNGTIDDGTVYTFSRSDASVTDVNEKGLAFKIAPNPSQDFLQISLKEEVETESIAIVDLQGKVVLSDLTINQKIDVSTLEAGVYMVQIQTADGLSTQKFIKK